MSATPLDQQAIRERLRARRSELRTRATRVEHDRGHSDEPLVADFAEQALQTQNDAVLEGIDDAALAEIAEIDAALARLDDGRYGTCRKCQEPIDPQRLMAMPQAVLCVSCSGSAARG